MATSNTPIINSLVKMDWNLGIIFELDWTDIFICLCIGNYKIPLTLILSPTGRGEGDGFVHCSRLKYSINISW
ncbi:MAG: hypothetical protein HZA00_02870 [Nitrospinae bacterium]|nr:hypothetical protein [Nitrospinota bacterium]